MRNPSDLTAPEWLDIALWRHRGEPWRHIARRLGVKPKALRSAWCMRRKGKCSYSHSETPSEEQSRQARAVIALDAPRGGVRPDTPGARRKQDTVRAMRARGCSDEQIARALGEVPLCLPSSDPYGMDPRGRPIR